MRSGVILPMTKAEKLGAWLSRGRDVTAGKVLFHLRARPIPRISVIKCGFRSSNAG